MADHLIVDASSNTNSDLTLCGQPKQPQPPIPSFLSRNDNVPFYFFLFLFFSVLPRASFVWLSSTRVYVMHCTHHTHCTHCTHVLHFRSCCRTNDIAFIADKHVGSAFVEQLVSRVSLSLSLSLGETHAHTDHSHTYTLSSLLSS